MNAEKKVFTISLVGLARYWPAVLMYIHLSGTPLSLPAQAGPTMRKSRQYCFTLDTRSKTLLDDLSNTLDMPMSRVVAVAISAMHQEVNSDDHLERLIWESGSSARLLVAMLHDCRRLIQSNPDNANRLNRVKETLTEQWLAGGASIDLSPEQKHDLAWFERLRNSGVEAELQVIRRALMDNRLPKAGEVQ